jgi:serralysin
VEWGLVKLGGDSGRDFINGSAGNDTINGGQQRDVMTGGTGADVFVLSSRIDTASTASGADIIRDFRVGEDLIDLSIIDARPGVAGDQAFVFVGTGSLSGATGRLRYDPATGLLQGDITGDGVADFAIVMGNNAVLIALDFIL